MADPRENILNRLVAVCAGVTGIAAVARNKLDVPGIARPAAIIMDGAESRRETEMRPRRGWAKQMMELRPEIRLRIRNDTGEDAGAQASVLRGRLVAAIYGDIQIREYVGTNGDIQFDEFSVDEPDPETREYRASLGMTFTYPFNLADFT